MKAQYTVTFCLLFYSCVFDYTNHAKIKNNKNEEVKINIHYNKEALDSAYMGNRNLYNSYLFDLSKEVTPNKSEFDSLNLVINIILGVNESATVETSVNRAPDFLIIKNITVATKTDTTVYLKSSLKKLFKKADNSNYILNIE